ncbi:MAG: DeoR/GlpR transcriptional regulator [Verrucomicrobia bacterium]|nr:DeoR/GlpR transcriptional regulator [Verrucomicrobiota bacterium]
MRILGIKSADMGISNRSIRGNVLPARRHLELVELIRSRGQMTVNELANHFTVSGDTVRRDLDLLAGQGLIKRTHGGAVAMDNLVHQDSPFTQRMSTRVPAKRRIARAAARLISDGETLLINGGSTTKLFAAELAERRNLTVVTNNLGLPATLPTDCCSNVYILGGEYNGDAQVTVGPVGFVSAGNITVDSAVIGVGGIAIKEGLTTTVLEECSMILAMICAARRTIVLADATKFGHRSFAHIAPLERIQILVTDEAPPKDLAQALHESGVEVIVAAKE